MPSVIERAVDVDRSSAVSPSATHRLPHRSGRPAWARVGRALGLTTAVVLTTLIGTAHAQTPKVGQLEVVAELPIRPGNVAPGPDGRLFATVHPLGAPTNAQLIEITGRDRYAPWPSADLQRGTGTPSDDRLDTPLGVQADHHGRLWVIDMGLQLGKTRLWSFDIRSGKVLQRIELPSDIAPKSSFVQDLAVDDDGGWVYLADIANPGIITVNLSNGQARRFSGHRSLQAEDAAKMIIDNKPIQFSGAPAKVAVNPITLSADRKTVFFGAMNGHTWYAVPAALLRPGVPDAQTGAAIRREGGKPVSDGAATTPDGRHFFTNVNERGVDVLDRHGALAPLVRDARLDWPDSVHYFDGGWLYISVNQLYKTPAFTGAGDLGTPPYRVMRVWIGEMKPTVKKP